MGGNPAPPDQVGWGCGPGGAQNKPRPSVQEGLLGRAARDAPDRQGGVLPGWGPRGLPGVGATWQGHWTAPGGRACLAEQWSSGKGARPLP